MAAARIVSIGKVSRALDHASGRFAGSTGAVACSASCRNVANVASLTPGVVWGGLAGAETSIRAASSNKDVVGGLLVSWLAVFMGFW